MCVPTCMLSTCLLIFSLCVSLCVLLLFSAFLSLCDTLNMCLCLVTSTIKTKLLKQVYRYNKFRRSFSKCFSELIIKYSTVKPVLRGHSKRSPKIGFQLRLSLNAGQKYCRMLKGSILQYFRLPLSYHFPLRPWF